MVLLTDLIKIFAGAICIIFKASALTSKIHKTIKFPIIAKIPEFLRIIPGQQLIFKSQIGKSIKFLPSTIRLRYSL